MTRGPLLLLLVLSVALSLWATPGRCAWQNFLVKDGLASAEVRGIYQDSSGVYWFTTSAGLSRFDGVRWTTVTTLPGLYATVVGWPFEDHRGGFWVTTSAGLARRSGGTWTFYPIYNLAPRLIDRSGNVWLTGNRWATGGVLYGGGVVRFDGSTFTTFNTTNGLRDDRVSDVTEDRAGNIWCATLNGVSRFDGTSWTTLDPPGSYVIDAVAVDSSGAIWTGSRSGLYRFDGTNWQQVLTPCTNQGVSEILIDHRGTLWANAGSCYGSVGGLMRYDSTAHQLLEPLSPQQSAILAMLEDECGNLWIGTQGDGAARFDGVNARQFTDSNNQAIAARVMLEESPGRVWFGSWSGLWKYEPAGGLTQVFTKADGLPGNRIDNLLSDGPGRFWIAAFDDTTGGVSHYDGNTWTTYTKANGLPGDYVTSIYRDRSGNLWATPHQRLVFTDNALGVARFDGVAWTSFRSTDGLGHDIVNAMLQDRSGAMWFATNYGVSRFDATGWSTFRNELANTYVVSIHEDTSGNLWFGTIDGVTRFDGTTWTTLRDVGGVRLGWVSFVLEQRSGNLWFHADPGLVRFDGSSWSKFGEAEGLASQYVGAGIEDRKGDVWFGTRSGVSHFDGYGWVTLTTADGLASNDVFAILEDALGSIWFGGFGLTRYDPDRTPPQTVIVSQPEALTSSRNATITFAAAFGEVARIEYSYSFDDGSWSPWSPSGVWTAFGLADGVHQMRVKSRDWMHNEDPTPASADFEIDATPPAPVITSPSYGQAVKGTVTIRGTAADARFLSYGVETRLKGATSWDPGQVTLPDGGFLPVSDAVLGVWSTADLEDGDYELRLSVTDRLGLTGTYLLGVVVDNHAPWANQTSPATVERDAGGDVFTTQREAHLYIAPRALDRDALVTINANADGDVPATLPNGARRVSAGYALDWSGASLAKPANFDMAFTPPVSGAPTFYARAADGTWQHLGGDVDQDSRRITVPISAPGAYALFTGDGLGVGGATVGALSLTPRVFSPHGTFASNAIGIGFTLGRQASVTIKVYSRSGRLIREVVSGESMAAGANLVYWDGHDRDGAIVSDGLYVVSLEALGHRLTQPLAVVK